MIGAGAPELIDSHCHLESARLPQTPAAALAAARAVGVADIVMAGVGPAGWAAQARLAADHEGVWPVFGLHPWTAASTDDVGLADVMAALAAALDETPGVVAVGETGLDGYTAERRAGLARQEASLRAHLALAEARGLPVVLHLLKAHDRALRVLKDAGVPAAGGVVHSFSGSAELAREYLRLGLHISFCGTVTNPQSRKLRAAAAAVPADRLLLETDSPDQAPHPHKGQPNRPAWLPLVAAALADARGVDIAEIARVTTANARRLFRLEPRGSS